MSIKKKTIQPKLSFADDNDNDDNDNDTSTSIATVTKLKSMKKRKIKQAPNVDSINDSILLIQESIHNSNSNDYSKESLLRLKEAQNFKVFNQDSSRVIEDSSLILIMEDANHTDHSNDGINYNIDGNDVQNYNDHECMIGNNEILLELSGEEAEAEFIAFTERTKSGSGSQIIDSSSSSSSSSSSCAIQSMSYETYIDHNTNALDNEAIYQAKLENKKMMNKEYMKERLYISNSTSTSSTIIGSNKRDAKMMMTYDLSMDNDRSWEDEIIKRGVINTNVLVEKHIDIDNSSSGDIIGSNSNGGNDRVHNIITQRISTGRRTGKSRNNNYNDDDNGKNELISINDIIGAVKVGLEKLNANCDVINMKIHHLESDIEISRRHEMKYREMVDKEVKHLNNIQEIKYFYASMVGMLREKQSLIEELYSTVISSVKDYQILIKNRRIDAQEDRVYCLKQVSYDLNQSMIGSMYAYIQCINAHTLFFAHLSDYMYV